MGLRFILWISVFGRPKTRTRLEKESAYWQMGCQQRGIAITIPNPIFPDGINFHIDVEDSDSFEGGVLV